MQYFSQSNLSTTFQIYFLFLPSTWDTGVFSHFHAILASVFSWALPWPVNAADIPLLTLTPHVLLLHSTVHSSAGSSELEYFLQKTYLEKDKVNFNFNCSACLSHNLYTYSNTSLNPCFIFYKNSILSQRRVNSEVVVVPISAWKVFSDHPQLAVAKKEVRNKVTQARVSHPLELKIMTLEHVD